MVGIIRFLINFYLFLSYIWGEGCWWRMECHWMFVIVFFCFFWEGGVDYFGGKLFLYTWQYQYRKSSICWTIMFHPCWTNENIFILFYLTWSICSFEKKSIESIRYANEYGSFLFRRKRLMSPLNRKKYLPRLLKPRFYFPDKW